MLSSVYIKEIVTLYYKPFVTRLNFCQCGYCNIFRDNDANIDYVLILVSVIYQVRLDILYHGQVVYDIQYMFIVYIEYFHLIYIFSFNIYIFILNRIHIIKM